MAEEYSGSAGVAPMSAADAPARDADDDIEVPAFLQTSHNGHQAESESSAGGNTKKKRSSSSGATVVGAAGAAVSNATQQLQQAAAPAVQQIQQAAAPAVQQAQQKTGQMLGQVQQQATSRMDQQKQHAAESLGSVANTLRQTGQQLRENDDSVVTQYAAQYGETAADQVERVANYLREHDVNELVHEVEDFARREPAIFIGGAFLLGLLGARFLKSSAPPPPMPSNHRPRFSNAVNDIG